MIEIRTMTNFVFNKISKLFEDTQLKKFIIFSRKIKTTILSEDNSKNSTPRFTI